MSEGTKLLKSYYGIYPHWLRSHVVWVANNNGHPYLVISTEYI